MSNSSPDMLRKRVKLSATDWALRASVASVFVVFGLEKLFGSNWVKLFAEIGFGQWFRHFTGILQIAGGALLLIPWTARFGAALIACTMLGAVVVHLFILGTGVFAAIIPAGLLGLVVFVGSKEPGQAEPSDSFLKLG